MNSQICKVETGSLAAIPLINLLFFLLILRSHEINAPTSGCTLYIPFIATSLLTPAALQASNATAMLDGCSMYAK